MTQTQSLDQLMSNSNGKKSLLKESLFTDLDILAMIIACIGHDLDHPGLGNSYFQKAKEARAVACNNSSILENYHLYTLNSLIDQTNLLSGLSYEQMQQVKDTMKSIIMATDMSVHFNI